MKFNLFLIILLVVIMFAPIVASMLGLVEPFGVNKNSKKKEGFKAAKKGKGKKH